MCVQMIIMSEIEPVLTYPRLSLHLRAYKQIGKDPAQSPVFFVWEPLN